MKKNNRDSSLLTEHNWTLIESGGKRFAVPSSAVVRTAEIPKIHPIPYAPDHIKGIAHMDGDLMPCLDLSGVFSNGEGANVNAEVLVLSWHDRKVIMLIERAVLQINIDDEMRESITRMEQDADSVSAVVGEMTLQGGNVFLLDPTYLCSFSHKHREVSGRPGLVADHHNAEQLEGHDRGLENLFLYLSLADQVFAVPVLKCHEIIPLEKITKIPGADSKISGLTLVREASFLVVDTAACLGLEGCVSEQAVIVSEKGDAFLLAIENVNAVRAIANQHVRRVGSDNALISGVIEVPDEPLCAILSPSALYASIPNLHRFIPTSGRDERDNDIEQVWHRFLLVAWGDESYAIPLECIDNLSPLQRMRSINSDNFSGLIGAEGEVIPVLKSSVFYGDTSRPALLEGFIIVRQGSKRFAVELEQANSIIDVPAGDIQQSRSVDSRYAATVKYNGQLVSLISLNDLATMELPEQEQSS
ncbi:MAG: chemotaxis protein CheW [Alcanivoracaceae bacterium]|nr:chemotaxis protein CheW [Alcanivoracaceae bacterium]